MSGGGILCGNCGMRSYCGNIECPHSPVDVVHKCSPSESLADARRYAAHLESEIAKARTVWVGHIGDALYPKAHLRSGCTGCRIARMFGWDAP